MNMVRVTSYYQDGRFTTCEHIYAAQFQQDAIDRFKKEYPEHAKECIIVAEYYDSEDPKNAEHFEVCKRCGCVHYW